MKNTQRRDDAASITLAYRSVDGEEGYPGTVDATVSYALHADNRLEVLMEATSDAPTVVNMFNHSYFNLRGHGEGTIRDHVVRIDADQYLPVDPEAYIVTGEILSVDDTPFDLRTPRRLGDAIDAAGGGLDYGYVLSDHMTDQPRTVARIEEPESGRVLEYATNNVSIHMYDGGHMPGDLVGKGGRAYGPHHGISLETQAFPNAINTPHFPSPILRPGERYAHAVTFAFSVLAR